MLPIVQRELMLAARALSTYRNRVLVVGVCTLVATLIMLLSLGGLNPSMIGRQMFGTLTFLALLFCVFDGVRKTADCLSEEIREGTIGLLFLTDLKSHDIVIGKLAANSLNSIYGLLSIMPLLGLPMLMGGVLLGEFIRVSIALLSVLMFSLCAGMWVSSWTRDEQASISRSFALMLLFMFVPEFFPYHFVKLLSPYEAFRIASTGFYQSHLLGQYYLALATTQILSLIFLVLASVTLPFTFRSEPKALSLPKRFSKKPAHFAAQDLPLHLTRLTVSKLGDENPMHWLASRKGLQRKTGNMYLVLAVFLGVSCILFSIFIDYSWTAFIALFLVLNFLFKLRFASISCNCMAEARRNNALEMIMVTPLGESEILNGIESAQNRLLRSGLKMYAIEWACLTTSFLISAIRDNHFSGTSSDTASLCFIASCLYGLIFVGDCAALRATGAWMGLVSPKESSAVFKTAMLVLVIPVLSLMLSCFGLPILFGLPLFCLVFFGSKLRAQFRTIVENRYQPVPKSLPMNSVATPPII